MPSRHALMTVLFALLFPLAIPQSGMASDAEDIASVLSEQAFNVRDRLAILNLLHVYSHAADGLHTDLYGEMFTEDALFNIVPPEASAESQAQTMGRGRAAIVEGLAARHEAFRAAKTQRRHFLTNPIIWNQTEKSAEVSVYLQLRSTAIGEASALIATGRYQGRVQKTAAGWRIASWTIFTDQAFD